MGDPDVQKYLNVMEVEVGGWRVVSIGYSLSDVSPVPVPNEVPAPEVGHITVLCSMRLEVGREVEALKAITQSASSDRHPELDRHRSSSRLVVERSRWC